MPMLCERCKRETHGEETCNYCNRQVCRACVKSSQRIGKVLRLVICRDCWGVMKKRSAFKSKKEMRTIQIEE